MYMHACVCICIFIHVCVCVCVSLWLLYYCHSVAWGDSPCRQQNWYPLASNLQNPTPRLCISLSASPLSPVSGLVGRLCQLVVLCWLRYDILWRDVGIHWPWCPVSWTKWSFTAKNANHEPIYQIPQQPNAKKLSMFETGLIYAAVLLEWQNCRLCCSGQLICGEQEVRENLKLTTKEIIV